MNALWGRLVHRFMRTAVPIFAFALVCATAQLYVLPNNKIKNASFDFLQVASIDTSSSAVGIADSGLYFMSADEVNTALDAMTNMGVTQIRMFVPWRDIEATKGSYNWASVDKVVNAAAARGIAVAAVVTSSPIWATDYAVSPYGEVRNPGDFGSFMGQLAARYGAGTGDPESAKISAYEVWNEPQNFLSWFPSPDASEYTALLKAAYTAIKAVDPSGTVIGGVVTAGMTWGNFNINPVDFVAAMYASGAQGYFDALSYHPYNYNTKFSAGKDIANSAYKQLLAIQKLMKQYGDDAKKIWASEYGIPTTIVSESEQAAFITDFIDAWSKIAGVGPQFIYSLLDLETGAEDRQKNFGLFHDDWTPKEVVAAIAAWIAGHPTDVELPPTGGSETPNNPLNVIAQIFKTINMLANSVASMVGATVHSISGSVQKIVDSVVKIFTKILGVFSPSLKTPAAAAVVALAAQPASDETSDSATAAARQSVQTADVESADTGSAASVDKVAEASVPATVEAAPVSVVDETPAAQGSTGSEAPAQPVESTPVVEEPTVGEPVSEPVTEPVSEPVTTVDEDSSAPADDATDESTDDSTDTSSTKTGSSNSSADRDDDADVTVEKNVTKDDADGSLDPSDSKTSSGGLPAAKSDASDDDSSGTGTSGKSTADSGRGNAHSGSASDGGSASGSDS